jgi:dimethylargininase
MRALIRRPGPRLAEGIVTHIDRSPVDLDRALAQHEAYAEALPANGWRTVEVEPAPDCPDSVFIEDVLVVRGDLAIVTRPGAPQRRPETPGAEKAALAMGLRVARIVPPGTLDGGDVLQAGDTVYIGQSTRSNAAGIAQLRALLPGDRVVAVPLEGVLHLKSAITALPNGTFITYRGVRPDLFGSVRQVSEEGGCHVVPLGANTILIAASAPRTAEALAEDGFDPVVVDIDEFEKLEGCVTCLSVLVSATGADTAP